MGLRIEGFGFGFGFGSKVIGLWDYRIEVFKVIAIFYVYGITA